MLKINISNLQDGDHVFNFIISPAEINIDLVEVIDNVIVRANLYKSINQFSINIKIKGMFRLECDRCLMDYNYNFDKMFDLIYKFDYEGKKIGDSNDDIKFIPPKTNFIDLKEDVRDYILLSIPMRKVPDEKEGICTYCNKDINDMLNVTRREELNPIWEKLIKAKTK